MLAASCFFSSSDIVTLVVTSVPELSSGTVVTSGTVVVSVIVVVVVVSVACGGAKVPQAVSDIIITAAARAA